MGFNKIEFFNEFKMNEVNMLVTTLADDVATTMRNRTFHKTEELVDLKNKRVTLSVIEKYCEENINRWDNHSKDVKNEVLNKIIDDFEKDGFEVDIEH